MILIKFMFILLLFDFKILTKDCIGVECDCGIIAQPPGSEIRVKSVKNNFTFELYDESKDFVQNTQVWYRCFEPNNLLVGNEVRACDRGKWLGSVPRCGN
jgi:hypothetical protein